MGELQRGNQGSPPEPPFSVALGLAAALDLAFFGVRTSWIAEVGGDPRTPLLRCARPGETFICVYLPLIGYRDALSIFFS